MSFYNNANELLKDAVDKGLINIVRPKLQIGGTEVQFPSSIIVVLNPEKWLAFLTNVISNSDSQDEINYATKVLNVFQEKYKQLQQSEKKEITADDVINLSTDLNKCNTVDEIFQLIGIQQSPKQLRIKKVEALPQQDKVVWLRPTNVDGKCRYCARDYDWYVERRDLHGPFGGLLHHYSIFTDEQKEVAQFDTLRDAKNNFLNIYRHLKNLIKCE